MSIDFNLPVSTTNYLTLVAELKSGRQALSQLLDPAVAGTVGNPVTGAYRVKSATDGAVERFASGSWGATPINGINYAAGDIGISTASVASLGTSLRTLQIKGGATNKSGGLRLSSSDSSQEFGVYVSAGLALLATLTSHPIVFAPNNIEAGRFTTSQNLCLGTTTEAGKLTVNGKLRVLGNDYELDTGMLTTNSPANPLRMGVNATESMRILNGGKILLKSTTDSGLGTLQVIGDASGNVADLATATGDALARLRSGAVSSAVSLCLQNASTGTGSSAGMQLRLEADNITTALWSAESGDMKFATSNTVRHRLKATGHWWPEADQTYDWGDSTHRMRKLWGKDADLSGALAVSGAAAFGGAVALGDAAADAITMTGTPGGQLLGATWTPTLTNNLNVAASSVVGAMYLRIGAFVYAKVELNIDPTTASLNTAIGITLPVASNFTAQVDAIGSGFRVINPLVGDVAADTVNDRVTFGYACDTDATSRPFIVEFMYQIK